MVDININEIKRYLGLPENSEYWIDSWEIAQQNFNRKKIYSILSSEEVASICEYLKISSEIKEELLRLAEVIKKDIYLERLFWYCYWLLFEKEGLPCEKAEEVSKWPHSSKLGKDKALFYVLVLFGGIPYVKKLHQKYRIPEEITKATLSDIPLWIMRYIRKYKYPGIRNLIWHINHFSGIIFRIGRLQFKFEQFNWEYTAWKNRETKEVVLFTGDNMEFREDGQFNGLNDVYDKNSWKSFYRCTCDYVEGNEISPYGYALREVRRIDIKKWEKILEKGDRVIGIHIPASGSMDFEECGNSIKEAIKFFEKYFPDRAYRVFTCHSWLLDPQLERYLRDDSNIIKFLREFYLYPINDKASGSSIFKHVFEEAEDPGDYRKKLDSYPQITSLQQSIIEHVKKGNFWQATGGFIEKEDFSWGTQRYRKSYKKIFQKFCDK